MNVFPVITGVGLVTPLGRSVPQTWDALLRGESIVNHATVASFISGVPAVSGLAIEAAHEAIDQSRWSSNPIAANQTALIVGTSKGAIVSCLGWNDPKVGLDQVALDVSKSVELVDGPRLTLSAACASGLHALIRGAMMIISGEASRVLVVAAEASVHPMFLASFGRLGVIPPAGVPCRPFDENRKGFLMSEAAAAVCLERNDLNDRGIVRVERLAMGGDATHLTAGDLNGTTLRSVIKQVIDGRSIDLIHAHGTGTEINDRIELGVLESQVISETTPTTLYSHKGALGHSLGAAGLISVVLNCLCHLTSRVPGNVNMFNPMPARKIQLSQEKVFREVRRSVVCASGFGGAVAAVRLENLSARKRPGP